MDSIKSNNSGSYDDCNASSRTGVYASHSLGSLREYGMANVKEREKGWTGKCEVDRWQNNLLCLLWTFSLWQLVNGPKMENNTTHYTPWQAERNDNYRFTTEFHCNIKQTTISQNYIFIKVFLSSFSISFCPLLLRSSPLSLRQHKQRTEGINNLTIPTYLRKYISTLNAL